MGSNQVLKDVQGLKEQNWAGSYGYRAARVLHPGSLGELRELVTGSRHIRALGSRHSFNALADSTGTLVSLAGIGGGISIDARNRTATVGAGTTYGELATELARAGFALHNMASLPHISVAGAIATGTHGSGDRNGNLGTAVLSLGLLDAQGDLHTVARGEHADFAGHVVGLGALGIVTDVTLHIEPAYAISQTVYEGPAWEDVLGELDELTGAAYSVSLFTNWTGDRLGQVWLKSRAGETGMRGPLPGCLAGKEASARVHPLPGGNAENCTGQGGVPGSWHDRLPHFRMEFTPSNGAEIQSEYLLPREHARAAIAAVRDLGPVISPILQISEIRTVAADDLWMSPSHERDSMALHFTWVRDQPAIDMVLPLLEEALVPFRARPHWGKHFLADADRLGGLYPRLADFKALVRKTDPEGKFGNDFLAAKLLS